MGSIRLPGKVKLIVGLLSNKAGLLKTIGCDLEKAFKNKVDYGSELLDFLHTDYYKEEFGPALKRKFLSFKNPVALKNIYRVKIETDAIERMFSENGKRTINIDPGYLDLSKLVLFSTKDYSHRIYLDGGIFAEVTLFFKDNTFNPWDWTYPDYKSRPYIEIFNRIRQIYKKSTA